jgi:hypothetical protein
MDRDELLQEFLITTSDSLFKGIQEKLGVDDGGYAGMFWPDSQAFQATIEAIKAKAPSFEVDKDKAFSQAMPEIPDQPDLDTGSLRATSVAFLGHLGDVVGADLGDEALVGQYVRSLESYIAGERDLANGGGPRL